MPTTPRKKNPNDATFRNINALKSRVAALEALVKAQGKTLARLARLKAPRW